MVPPDTWTDRPTRRSDRETSQNRGKQARIDRICLKSRLRQPALAGCSSRRCCTRRTRRPRLTFPLRQPRRGGRDRPARVRADDETLLRGGPLTCSFSQPWFRTLMSCRTLDPMRPVDQVVSRSVPSNDQQRHEREGWQVDSIAAVDLVHAEGGAADGLDRAWPMWERLAGRLRQAVA